MSLSTIKYKDKINPMRKIFLIGILLVSMLSCKETQEPAGYKINGLLKNIPDNTIVYISSNNKKIDSTIVLNGKFEFSGKVEIPTNVFLIIEKPFNYTSFWLENSEIYFEAEEGNFNEAIIIGSKVQEEEEVLNKRLSSIRKEMDDFEDTDFEELTDQEIDSIYKHLDGRYATINQNFIRDFPNSLISSHVLSIYASTWGKKITKELFEKFPIENKNTPNGKEIARYIALNQEPEIGALYIDFEMEDENGMLRKLSEMKGKVVLLEFWASWCGPCRVENPNLVKTYERFHPKGFEIFAVSLDIKKDNWLQAIENDQLNWTHVSDLKGNGNLASLIYGISAIPDNFLIDQNGVIVGRGLRGETLNRKLEKMLE